MSCSGLGLSVSSKLELPPLRAGSACGPGDVPCFGNLSQLRPGFCARAARGAGEREHSCSIEILGVR